jgi:hypothetical protein
MINRKLKQYTTTKPPLQKILQGILHPEDESKQNQKKTGNIKPQEKKGQVIRESGNSIDSTVHNQFLKQQKQLNGSNHHIPINVNTECQWTQLPHEKTPFGKLDQKGRSNNQFFID